jgi:8-oxo-dGTP pyrophosphatase MutT (NUDIX family)
MSRFDAIVARLASRLGPVAGLDPADPAWPAPLRKAAVMVMLHPREDVPYVPMIVRGDDAPVHSGQTALPGGRWEERDGSLIATALREVEEEVGVEASRLRVLGELDDLPTRTGYLIRPVVAVLDAPRFVPSPREVVEVFDVPLAMFADPSGAEDLGVRELGTVKYPLRAYRIEGRKVWGVAARVLEIVAALAAE